MRTFLSILVCICLSGAINMVTAADFPRVSGIVGQEGAWVLAIIETGAGECSVISRNEAFGSGVVAKITAQGIEIRYSDHSEFLPLQGGAFITTEQTDPGHNPETPRTTTKSVSREEVVAALAQAENNLSAKKNLSVNALVGLPKAAKISAVNFTATSTQQEAGRLLREELEKGNIPKITVTGVPGLSEIYLTPDTPYKPPPLPDYLP